MSELRRLAIIDNDDLMRVRCRTVLLTYVLTYARSVDDIEQNESTDKRDKVRGIR
jgi:hypothetical protein